MSSYILSPATDFIQIFCKSWWLGNVSETCKVLGYSRDSFYRFKKLYEEGICEHFHRAMQDEFYSIAFRKKMYSSLEEMQEDIDPGLNYITMSEHLLVGTAWRNTYANLF